MPRSIQPLEAAPAAPLKVIAFGPRAQDSLCNLTPLTWPGRAIIQGRPFCDSFALPLPISPRSRLLGTTADGMATFVGPAREQETRTQLPLMPGDRAAVMEDLTVVEDLGRAVRVRQYDGSTRTVLLRAGEPAPAVGETLRAHPAHWARERIEIMAVQVMQLEQIGEDEARRHGPQAVSRSHNRALPGTSWRAGFEEMWKARHAAARSPWNGSQWVEVIRFQRLA